MFYANPGLIINSKKAKQIFRTWKNVTAVDLGEGKHYLQDSHPHELGEGIVAWYNKPFVL